MFAVAIHHVFRHIFKKSTFGILPLDPKWEDHSPRPVICLFLVFCWLPLIDTVSLQPNHLNFRLNQLKLIQSSLIMLKLDPATITQWKSRMFLLVKVKWRLMVMTTMSIQPHWQYGRSCSSQIDKDFVGSVRTCKNPDDNRDESRLIPSKLWLLHLL